MTDMSFDPQAAVTPADGIDFDVTIPSQFHEADKAGDGGDTAVVIPFPAPTPAASDAGKPAPTGAFEGGKGGDEEAASPPSPSLTASIDEGEPLPPPAVVDDVYRPAPATNPVVDALMAKGYHRRFVGGNEHRITCPWNDEHAPGQPSEAYYFAPSDETPGGSYFCGCKHREKRRLGSLLERLDVDFRDARCKSIVRIKKSEFHRTVAAAEKVLAQRGGFYRSNGLVVAIKTDRDTGDVRTEPVNDQTLMLHLSAGSDWEEYSSTKEEWQRCGVPKDVVNAVIKGEGCGELPVLKGLARQPYFHPNGELLVRTPGFDTRSGIYAAFDETAFFTPALTRENALKALRRLDDLLEEFEFAGKVDRATAISAMLTASIRDYLKVAPAYNITASSSGSGKSYLAEVIAPFAGPGAPRSISYPGTNEEATKVVLSLALEQPAVVCFDDMPMDWLPHGAMNRMLSNGLVTERVLGSSKVVTARASSFVMGTGNNIRPIRDMARRVVSIYILPQTETAATREYEGRPAEEVRLHRGRYVSDALTIVGAWRQAGGPRANVPNVAGFEEWSDYCRHSLIWLGLPDPATSLIEQVANDPDAEALGNLLHAWRTAFGTKPTMVRQIIKRIDDNGDPDLKDAVMELPFIERGHINQSRFGRYLGRQKNRIVKGLQLVEAEHSERRAWSVVTVTNKPQKPEPILPEEMNGIERVWLDQMIERGQLPTVLNEAA